MIYFNIMPGFGHCAGSLTLWLLSASLAAQSDPVRLQQILEQAVAAQQSGRLQAAIEGYLSFLEAEPDYPDVRSNLGAAYAALGRLGEALEQYRLALELDAANPAFRFNYALGLYKTGRLSQAADEFENVLQRDPGHRSALLLLADCRFRSGQNQEVIALLADREDDFQEDQGWIYLLGTALIREGQLEKGQLLIDRILRKGESAQAYLMLGTARMLGRDYHGALADFKRAAQLDSSLPSIHFLYGRALWDTGNPTAAKSAFETELRNNPHDFDANLALGMLLTQERELERARVYLEHALQIRPAAAEAQNQLALAYLGLGRLDEARQLFEKAVHQAPKFVEAHVSLATVYYRLKRKADGDRHRAIVEQLNAERQAARPGADQELGPAYRGAPRPDPPPTP